MPGRLGGPNPWTGFGPSAVTIPRHGVLEGVRRGSAFVGLFAALIPAFRAGRMNVLNAIATE
ncbi:hypothetical protein [Streptomyces blattellae]|uniref:hypothetical protein n=1 Tax=Streptomyces blattellae TaxID=2569855 RepID=UPI0012B9C384|nr:hypothetical protein [Streptomyces blattellae]